MSLADQLTVLTAVVLCLGGLDLLVSPKLKNAIADAFVALRRSNKQVDQRIQNIFRQLEETKIRMIVAAWAGFEIICAVTVLAWGHAIGNEKRIIFWLDTLIISALVNLGIFFCFFILLSIFRVRVSVWRAATLVVLLLALAIAAAPVIATGTFVYRVDKLEKNMQYELVLVANPGVDPMDWYDDFQRVNLALVKKESLQKAGEIAKVVQKYEFFAQRTWLCKRSASEVIERILELDEKPSIFPIRDPIECKSLSEGREVQYPVRIVLTNIKYTRAIAFRMITRHAEYMQLLNYGLEFAIKPVTAQNLDEVQFSRLWQLVAPLVREEGIREAPTNAFEFIAFTYPHFRILIAIITFVLALSGVGLVLCASKIVDPITSQLTRKLLSDKPFTSIATLVLVIGVPLSMLFRLF
jgi:hypothetical protein